MTNRLPIRTAQTLRLTVALTALLVAGGCSPLSIALFGVRALTAQPQPEVVVGNGPVAVDQMLARSRGESTVEDATWHLTLQYAPNEMLLDENERVRLEASLLGMAGEVVVDLRVGPAGSSGDGDAGYRAIMRAHALGRELATAVVIRTVRYVPALPRNTMRLTLRPRWDDPRV